MRSQVKSCLVCDSTNTQSIITIPSIPVHCNILWNDRQDALNAPRGAIELAYCRKCGHTFNKLFQPELIEYTKNYENSLHFSPTFQGYAESLANQLIEKYDLHDKKIIEIGCGQGEFLQILCRLGCNRGSGFDPSYLNNQALDSNSEPITIIRDYYSAKYLDHQADFFCTRHVLEHLIEPKNILNVVGQATLKREASLFYIEVPNAWFMFNELSIWDIIHEHPSYFSKESLSYLLKSCNFEICDIGFGFGDQFLYAIASINMENTDSPLDQKENISDNEKMMNSFQSRFNKKVSKWQGFMKKIIDHEKKAVVWGAGSKGVTFLNLYADLQAIDYVVDINSRKFGKFIPGTGQQIVRPDFLSAYQPNDIIVMNPIYENEIKSMIDELDIDAIVSVA